MFLYKNYQNQEELLKAYGIIKRLSELNHIPSIHAYGLMLLDGKVIKDENKAIECFNKASKKGFALSTYRLGRCYYYGIGVTKDVDKALKYLNKACKDKSSYAMVFLAYLYCNGENNIKVDYKKAKEYLDEALYIRDPYAYYLLGQLYHNGYGVETDINQAFMYYDLASNDEVVEATVMCGHLLFSKKVAETDKHKAIDYYKKAAYLKNAEGMYSYALLLLTGTDCEKNLVEGRKMLEEAAKRGHEEAIKLLNKKKEK